MALRRLCMGVRIRLTSEEHAHAEPWRAPEKGHGLSDTQSTNLKQTTDDGPQTS